MKCGLLVTMKRNFWKGILVLVVAVFLLGVFFQAGCKTDKGNEKTGDRVLEEPKDKRIELLKQNKWFSPKFEDTITTEEGSEVCLTYWVFRRSNGRVEEVVYFHIFPKNTESIFYAIYGEDNKITRISYDDDETGIDIAIEDIKSFEVENNHGLSKELITKIVEKGTEHYFMVRKHFKVDTYEGLKEIIERGKARLTERVK